MAEAGYAVVDLDDLPWSRHGMDTAWAALTESLGATELAVDAVRLGADASVELADGPEQLLVPLDGAFALEGLEPAVGHPGLARVPAGVPGHIHAVAPTEAVVVSVPAEAASDTGPTAAALADATFVVPETSDVATAFLTAPLGCAGMKANARRLTPGQWVPYHTEGDQEELFVPVQGPASMRIDDEAFETPPGTVARVAPDVPRSAVNDGDADALWVMVGAPPTGGPTDWDPGSEILE